MNPMKMVAGMKNAAAVFLFIDIVQTHNAPKGHKDAFCVVLYERVCAYS